MLPKLEEQAPLKKSYEKLILQKGAKNNPKKKKSEEFSSMKQRSFYNRFDWLRAEMRVLDQIDSQNEEVLSQLIRFQEKCIEKSVPSMYSYFFLKCLLRKRQPTEQKQGKDEDYLLSKEAKQSLNAKLICQKLKLQQQLLSEQKSFYHQIESFILLREDLLRRLQKNYKEDSHNLLHEHINDIRYLNLEIVQLIMDWKQELLGSGSGQTVKNSQVQPIFYREDENYLNKMINDNANLINWVNKKNVKFISPPNPFFISQDGNKQEMSAQQKEKIDTAMDHISKEKALELRLMINPPEYMSKIGLERHFNAKKDQKNANSHSNIKSISGVYTRQNDRVFQTEKYSPYQNKPSRQRKSIQSGRNKSPLNTQREYEKQLREKSASLRQQVEKSSKQKEKIKSTLKQKEGEMKQRKSQTSKPKLISTKEGFNLRQIQEEKDQNSPYKSKITNLRKQVQRNLQQNREKTEPVRSQIKLKSSSVNKAKAPTSLAQVKMPKPKIKIVTERQTMVQPVVANHLISFLSSQKGKKENPTQEQEVRKNSTFYKNQNPPKKDLKKSRDKETNLIRPVTLTSLNKKQKSASVYDSGIFQKKKDSLTFDSLRNTSYSLYKPKVSQDVKKYVTKYKEEKSLSLSKQEQEISKEIARQKAQQKLQRKSSITKLSPNQKSLSARKAIKSNAIEIKPIKEKRQKLEDESIDDELKNLKSKIRDMTIMNVYGKKMKSPSKVTDSRADLLGHPDNESIFSKYDSPYKKQQKHLLKKEALKLEKRIQELMKKGANTETKGFYKAEENENQMQSEFNINDLQSINEGNQQELQSKLQNSRSQINQNIEKLQKKEQLIKQGNQLKAHEIQQKKKDKNKKTQELEEKKKRLRQLQENIQKMKAKRHSYSDPRTLSRIVESNEEVFGEKHKKISDLKGDQLKMIAENQKLQKEMKRQEEKFIRLKEQEFKVREETARKKYLSDIKEMKAEYLNKQREYEQRILKEEQQRKEHDIQLMKQKREMNEMKMKLEEQSLKQELLSQILKQEALREVELQKDSERQEKEIKKKLERQLKEKEQMEARIIENYQEEKQKIKLVYESMKEKNKRIEEENQRKLNQLEEAMKKKQEEESKLQELERQIEQIEKGRKELGKQLVEEKTKQNLQLQNDDSEIESMKTKLKQEILHEIIKRKQREDEEEMKFEEERRKRIQILEEQIKNALREEDEQLQKIENSQEKNLNQGQSFSESNDFERRYQELLKKEEEAEKRMAEKEREKEEFKKLEALNQKQNINKSEVHISNNELNNQKKAENELPQAEGRKQNEDVESDLLAVKQKPSVKQREHNQQNSIQNADSKKEQKVSDKNQSKQTLENNLNSNQNQNKSSENNGLNASLNNDSSKKKVLDSIFQKWELDFKESMETWRRNSKKIEKQASKQSLKRHQIDPQSQENKNRENIDKNKANDTNAKRYYTLRVLEGQVSKRMKIFSFERWRSSCTKGQIMKAEQQEPTKKSQVLEESSLKKQSIQSERKSHHITQEAVPTSENKNNQQISKEAIISQGQKQPQQKTTTEKTKRQELTQSEMKKSQSPEKDISSSALSKISIKQTDSEILQKYQALKPYLNDKVKFQMINQSQIDTFLNEFYNHFAHEVREMLPYQQNEMQAIFKNHKNLSKKIDIFSCNSVGWLDLETNKYTLLGSIECMNLIGKKYGEVQVEMVYLFDKKNPYQKQYLIKQIKIFEKVGYVFQKKLKEKEEALYSIKFIVKLPREVAGKNFVKPDGRLRIQSSIVLGGNIPASKTQQHLIKRHLMTYLFGETLKQGLSKQKLQEFYKTHENLNLDLHNLSKKMKLSAQPHNSQNPKIVTSFIDDQKAQLSVELSLPYTQIQQETYFNLPSQKHVNPQNGEEIFICDCKYENIRIVVMEIPEEKRKALEGVLIETYIESKIKKAEGQQPERIVNLLIEKLHTNKNQLQHIALEEKDPNNPLITKLSFKAKIQSNLIKASISAQQALKNDSYKMFKVQGQESTVDGYILAICQCNSNGVISRVLTGLYVQN